MGGKWQNSEIHITKMFFNVQAGTGILDCVHEMHEDSFRFESDGCRITPECVNVLKESYEKNGYLLLRNFLPTDEVQSARKFILTQMKDYLVSSNSSRATNPLLSPGLLKRPEVAHSACVKQILEHRRIASLMSSLLLPFAGKKVQIMLFSVQDSFIKSFSKM